MIDLNYTGKFSFYKEYLDDILCNQNQKYFIDVGTNESSNFMVLSKHENWIGLFVEPLKNELDKLERLDHCFYENLAVSTNKGKKIFYTINEFSEWSSFNLDHVTSKRNKGKVLEVDINVTTINELYKKYNFPYVDILKMDTETHDCDIINSIDFSCIDVKSIIFEYCGCKSKYDSNKEYLYNNNFELVHQDINNIIYKKHL